MSTSTAERTTGRTGHPGRRPAPESAASVPTPRDSGRAVGRAYARRAGRRDRLGGTGSAEVEGRSRFVLMIMAMLGVGLVASLWLSTTAAADSYRLNAARQSTRVLTEQIETATSQVHAMQSPLALAKAASSLDMVPVTDVARLIVGPDGHVTVFGTPKAAASKAIPPVSTTPPVGPSVSPVPSAADRMTPEQLVALQAQQDQGQPDPHVALARSGSPAAQPTRPEVGPAR